MAKQSAGEVSVLISANGQSAINEFGRVDNAVRRSVSRMDAEVGKFTKSVAKKFSTADIGKSVLQGFGIGSGFAIAQTAAEQLTNYFREQAEHAKSIEESTARQLDLTKQLIGLRQTDEQKLATLQKEAAKKWQELEAARAPRFQQSNVQFGYGSGKSMGMQQRALTNDEQANVAKLTEEYQKLSFAIESAKIKQEERATSQVATQYDKDQATRIRALSEGVKIQEDAFDALLKKQIDLNDESEKARKIREETAEGFRKAADPLRVYRQELEELYSVMGKLTPAEIAANESRIRGRMVDTALEDFFGDMDKQSGLFKGTEKLSEAAKDMGWAFSSAFEDAVLGAGKLKDVVNGLIKDIARIALRSAITQPLGNWIGGMFTNFGGGKATGGPVDSGTTYMVGEKGPELFTPSTSGTITPNHKLTGGRGDVFNFSYNIGSGVTQQQLMPILAMTKRDIIGSIADAKRRRTSMAAAL